MVKMEKDFQKIVKKFYSIGEKDKLGETMSNIDNIICFLKYYDIIDLDIYSKLSEININIFFDLYKNK